MTSLVKKMSFPKHIFSSHSQYASTPDTVDNARPFLLRTHFLLLLGHAESSPQTVLLVECPFSHQVELVRNGFFFSIQMASFRRHSEEEKRQYNFKEFHPTLRRTPLCGK